MEDELVGGYGMVIPDIFTHKRGVVLKIFFEANSFYEVLQTIPTLSKTMGYNMGHRTEIYTPRVTYRKFLEVSPDHARRYGELCIENGMLDPSVNPDIHLPIIIMEDNGIDISTLDLQHSYACPILLLLQQFEKLLEQTATLYKNNKIHCDIRDANVMINIDRESYSKERLISIINPRLTIIDFDQLMKKSRYERMDTSFYHFYNKPVEGCFLYAFKLKLPAKNTDIDTPQFENIKKCLKEYVTILFMSYKHVFKIFYNIRTEDQLLNTIIKEMLGYHGILYQFKSTVDTTDNFGLGFCLLKILAYFYYNNPEYVTGLKEKEKEALELTCKLLKSMVDFNVSKRPDPMSSYERMKKICSTLATSEENEWNIKPRERSNSVLIHAPVPNSRVASIHSVVPINSEVLHKLNKGGYRRNRMYRTAYRSHKRRTRQTHTRKHRKRRASKN